MPHHQEKNAENAALTEQLHKTNEKLHEVNKQLHETRDQLKETREQVQAIQINLEETTKCIMNMSDNP
ncbi:hypothetical protein IWQ61_010055, partial [Dispira simplex]